MLFCESLKLIEAETAWRRLLRLEARDRRDLIGFIHFTRLRLETMHRAENVADGRMLAPVAELLLNFPPFERFNVSGRKMQFLAQAAKDEIP